MFFSKSLENNQKKLVVVLAIALTVVIIVSIALVSFIVVQKVEKINTSMAKISFIKPANAAELYDEFICPCCGKSLDPENICCGAMKQRIDFIDSGVTNGMSYDDLLLAGVKEFGLKGLAKEETKQSIEKMLLAQAPEDAPKIDFSETKIDMGEVSQSEGVVFTTFHLKNTGKSSLIIDKINTSCGCTSAAIIYRGNEGPQFTMPGHGKENPKNWSVSIASGDTAELKVYFDPNAHGPQKEDILPITRTVSVFSNDPVEFEKQIRIDLSQVP